MIAFSIMGKSCRTVLNCVSLGNTTVTFLMRRSVSGRSKVQGGIRNIVSHPEAVFMPNKVAVVTKTTRYEFEQQRYRFAELSKEDMKHLLAMKGSSYSGLRERHNIHTRNLQHIVDSLQREGVDVRVMQRGEYNEDTVRWADAIISAGGDGTMLLVASKVFDKEKPVVGVNTDPERSEGHLCLPVRYTHSFPEALHKFKRGEFRWQGRQRIRVHLEGTGINPTPVDLHDLQLSREQHSQAHRLLTGAQRRAGAKDYSMADPVLLPVRGLNEIFIGESLSSRASYYEISVDDGPWEKQKSSGINVCTGTGSKAWSYNINKLADQDVEDILKIGKVQSGLPIPLDHDYIEKLTKEYNNSLTFDPEDCRMYFSIREPITNRIYSCTLLRGFAKKVSIRSRCWDACMVVDGGTSFEFNDGAIATITMSDEDQLRTALLSD